RRVTRAGEIDPGAQMLEHVLRIPVRHGRLHLAALVEEEGSAQRLKFGVSDQIYSVITLSYSPAYSPVARQVELVLGRPRAGRDVRKFRTSRLSALASPPFPHLPRVLVTKPIPRRG